jgi:nitroreductase
LTWNDVIEGLLAHRSVRAYLPNSLPDGIEGVLLAAAQSAATSSNMQMWSVVAVRDPARRARLAVLAGNQKHIAEAPLFLVWLADLSRAERIGAAKGQAMVALPFTETFMVGLIDAALAAQNAVVAAESLGLGTVYIGSMRNDPVRVSVELGLPSQVMAVFGLCVGVPDPARPTSVKPRLPASVVLHRERYDATAEASGLAAYDRQLLRFQQQEGMADRGWTGRVMERLGSVRGIGGREHMRAWLKTLGFPLD